MLTCAAAWPAHAADAKGKISKNFYRLPYDDGVAVDATNDYIGHGQSPAGDTGPMDIHAQAADQLIVAAAPGRVISVFDGNDDCGCHEDYGPCANMIRIDHENGERTVYLHIKKNSAMVDTGDCVVEGQPIAVEGDVGWTCGNGRSPVADVCLALVPDGAGDCGRHLHWFVQRLASNEFVNPMICNITGSFIVGGNTYEGSPCTPTSCADWHYVNLDASGLGDFSLYQAADSVVADSVAVSDSASLVMHAGTRVVLRPPFHIASRGHFRAEIGPCNTTTNAGCPAPVAVVGPAMDSRQEGAD